MSLKSMSKKDQHQVLASCGFDFPDDTTPSQGTHPHPHGHTHTHTHTSASPVGGAGVPMSLDAAKTVAGKGLKVVSEEMRKAFR
jgi:hypothetical protein